MVQCSWTEGSVGCHFFPEDGAEVVALVRLLGVLCALPCCFFMLFPNKVPASLRRLPLLSRLLNGGRLLAPGGAADHLRDETAAWCVRETHYTHTHTVFAMPFPNEKQRSFAKTGSGQTYT